jgi:hypothetical protein
MEDPQVEGIETEGNEDNEGSKSVKAAQRKTQISRWHQIHQCGAGILPASPKGKPRPPDGNKFTNWGYFSWSAAFFSLFD